MATTLKDSKSARVRRKLDHPVIDGDGHWLEPVPVLMEYMREIAGPEVVQAFEKTYRSRAAFYQWDAPERKRRRSARNNWWGTAGNTLDRATGFAPGLMYERLDDFGIDFAVVYPTLGITLSHLAPDELRQAACRALNMMSADMFRPYSNRLAPVALIPSFTPAEAIAEAEFAARALGLKGTMLDCTVRRPIEADAEWQPDPARRRQYVDALGLDSPYDYDPVWAKCRELGLAVTTHAGSKGWDGRSSTSSHVANHVGHFAEANHAAARSLFLGGVTHRYPGLNFAFLEGGIGWAINLYLDLIGHWRKLNRKAMDRELSPANLDLAELRQLLERYGDERLRRNLDALLHEHLDALEPFVTAEESVRRNAGADEFADVPIAGEDDIRRLFAEPFYFGCESDDPLTAWAFDGRMGKGKLKPVFSSDIGHFDVTDMTEVLEEAFELVEDGLLGEDDFREFTFANAVKLHGGMNPEFFAGTAVERAAAEVLAG